MYRFYFHYRIGLYRANDNDPKEMVGRGYLLYSVGPNGIDDGGKGIADRGKDKDCDDIGVQMTGK